MAPQVTVIILNWNGRHYLVPCLDAVLAQTFRDLEVILVDNGSTDGSVELIRATYPQIRLIVNERNLGFAVGNNQAIRASQSEFVATLNNDTEVAPDWLEQLVMAMKGRSQVGACMSKMLFADRPTTINSAGILLDRLGIAWDRLGGQPDDPTTSAPQMIFGACAGAALYRRAMLDEIGLFDEDFFAYLEDVDLAWRAQLADWETLYVPTAQLYHFHSATGVEGSPFKSRQLGRNKTWLIAKDYPTPHLWAYLPLILFYDLVAVAYATIARRDLNPLWGRLIGLRGLPAMLRKRRELERCQRISAAEMMRRMAPIEAPWRVLARYRHIRAPDEIASREAR
jgi:GT2 family glycosyltransferase